MAPALTICPSNVRSDRGRFVVVGGQELGVPTSNSAVFDGIAAGFAKVSILAISIIDAIISCLLYTSDAADE